MADETETPEAEVEAPEPEDRARKQGWVPEDEWTEQGKDPKHHKSAEQFLKDGEEIASAKSRENTELWREVKALRHELQSSTMQRNTELLRERLAKANEKRLEAVRESDEEAFVEAEKEVEAIRQEAGKQQPSSEAEAFKAKYPWIERPEFFDDLQKAYAAFSLKSGVDPDRFNKGVAQKAVNSVIKKYPFLQDEEAPDEQRAEKPKPARTPRETTESGGSAVASGGNIYDRLVKMDAEVKTLFEHDFNNPNHPWSKMKPADAKKAFVNGLRKQGLLKEWGLER